MKDDARLRENFFKPLPHGFFKASVHARIREKPKCPGRLPRAPFRFALDDAFALFANGLGNRSRRAGTRCICLLDELALKQMRAGVYFIGRVRKGIRAPRIAPPILPPAPAFDSKPNACFQNHCDELLEPVAAEIIQSIP